MSILSLRLNRWLYTGARVQARDARRQTMSVCRRGKEPAPVVMAITKPALSGAGLGFGMPQVAAPKQTQQ